MTTNVRRRRRAIDPDYEKKLLMVLRNSALGDESNIDLLNFEKNFSYRF